MDLVKICANTHVQVRAWGHVKEVVNLAVEEVVAKGVQGRVQTHVQVLPMLSIIAQIAIPFAHHHVKMVAESLVTIVVENHVKAVAKRDATQDVIQVARVDVKVTVKETVTTGAKQHAKKHVLDVAQVLVEVLVGGLFILME